MTDGHSTLRHIASVLRFTQALAVMLACVAGAVMWSQAVEFQHADNWVEHSHEVMGVIHDVRTQTLRAGVWIRSLSIDRTPKGMEEVRAACSEALAAARRLQELTVDNPAQQERARLIDAELRKTVSWMSDAADISELDGTAPLQAVLRMRIQHDSTRGLKSALDDMQSDERRLLRDRFEQQDRRRTWLERLASTFGSALIGFLVWSLVYSRHLMRSSHRQMARLTKVSTQDPLTGLLNRRALDDQVEALPESMPFAVIAFDLDHFKPINDTYGHAAGDEVLKYVSNRMREQCRSGDILARLGGDEFVVVLPGRWGGRRLEAIVTRLRAALHEPMDLGEVRIRVRASLGSALRGADGETFSQVLKAADKRSYAAKRGARDHWRVGEANDPQTSSVARGGRLTLAA